jgi:cytochrome c5
MKLLLTSCCLFSLVLLLSVAPATGSPLPQKKEAQNASQPDRSAKANPGERVFTANCARCHAAPMSLPPRITGTIVLHMRVRARLSRQDEQLLLKYLAP